MKVEPEVGLAFNVIVVPMATDCEQMAPQLMPPGALVIVPEPVPSLVTARITRLGLVVNVAVTEVAAFTVTAQVLVPEQAPLQPAKEEPAIFIEHAYFSSYSDSWLAHAKAYVGMITARLGLHRGSQVVELGSNDGYLLQYFVASGIPALGVEPAVNVAEMAIQRGVPTITKRFGRQRDQELVDGGTRADRVCGSNVLAQAPVVNDFVGGIKILLAPGGR